MVEPAASLHSCTTVQPCLYSERSLAHRRTHGFHRDELGDPFCQPEAFQAGCCEHDRVKLSFVQLADPRVDVAADTLYNKIWPHRTKLGDAPQGSCSDS